MTTTNGTRSSSSTSSSTLHHKDSALGLSLANDSRRSTGVSSTPIDSSHPPPLATLSSSSSSLSTLLPALAEEDLEAGQRPDVLDPEVSAAAAAHHNDHLSSAKSSQQQQQQPPRLEGLDALLERLRSGGASAGDGGYQPEAASDRRETDPLDTSTRIEAESVSPAWVHFFLVRSKRDPFFAIGYEEISRLCLLGLFSSRRVGRLHLVSLLQRGLDVLGP